MEPVVWGGRGLWSCPDVDMLWLPGVFADSKGLSNPGEVEALREKVYASLEAYCKHKYPEQPGRYGRTQTGAARLRVKPQQPGRK